MPQFTDVPGRPKRDGAGAAGSQNAVPPADQILDWLLPTI